MKVIEDKTKCKKNYLVIALLLLSISFVSAWTTTTFNNSLGTEDLVFSDTVNNYTRYVTVPASTTVSSAYFNLSGFWSMKKYLISNLTVYYNFDETSGYVGNNSINTSRNNATFTSNADWVTNGRRNGGIKPNNNVGITGLDFTGWQGITVNVWVNQTTSVAGMGTILQNGNLNGNGEILIRRWANNYTVLARGAGATTPETGPTNQTFNQWAMLTFVINGSDIAIYKNGTLVNKTAIPGGFTPGAGDYRATLFNDQPLTTPMSGTIFDEMSIYNTTLSDSYILDLYNAGAGSYYTTENPINLSVGDTEMQLDLNANGTIPYTYRVSSIQSYIQDYVSGTCSHLQCDVPFVFKYKGNGTIQYSNLYFSNEGFTENNQIYNGTTYETSSETFVLNLTYDSSASITGYLFYEGESYLASKVGTGNNVLLTKTIDIPTGNQVNTFYWTVNIGGNYYNSTIKTQEAGLINVSICNASGSAALGTPFINFSFKDESNGAVLNASNDLSSINYWLGGGTSYKTYTFQNTSYNYNYYFCGKPTGTYIADFSFKYSRSEYPLRTYTYSDASFSTSSMTQKILYLLGSTIGIYSSIRTADAAGSTISGVTVQYERKISGTWTLMGQEITGDDGVATFWVDPNYQYRFTATKAGYSNSQVTIQPSQTQYTITMNTAAQTTYRSLLEGIYYHMVPSSGTISCLDKQYTATIYSMNPNLENCKFELVDASDDTVLDTETGITNSTFCNLTIEYSDEENSHKFFGRLSVDTTNSTGFVIINADWKWVCMDLNNKKTWSSITSFFSELKDLSEFGTGNQAEYNRIVFFFLISTIILSVLIFFSGLEMNTPGISFFIIWGLALIASVGGFLTIDSGATMSAKIEQYGLVFTTAFFGVGYWLSIVRRTGE